MLWIKPSKEKPVNGETYVAYVKSKSSPIMGRFVELSSNNPDKLGHIITNDKTGYLVALDDTSEVVKFKLLVPHM